MNRHYAAVGILACALVLAGCDKDTFLYGPNAQVKKASERVSAMLEGMRTGGDGAGGDLQESACRWYNGKIFIADRDLLTVAYDGFEAWRRERGLEGLRIGSYSIVEATLKEGSTPPSVEMKVSIDGATYTLVVPDGQPIRWGSGYDVPRF